MRPSRRAGDASSARSARINRPGRSSMRATANRRSAMQPDRYLDFLGECRVLAASSEPIETRGRLTRAAGLVMEVVGLKLPVGAQVLVVQGDGLRLDAEVVGFAGERLFL